MLVCPAPVATASSRNGNEAVTGVVHGHIFNNVRQLANLVS